MFDILLLYDISIMLILFGLGASLASFYMAQIYRLEKGVGVAELINRGSYCEGCEKQLEWYELIPVISYLLFRGKCSKCHYSIPVLYPIFEFILGSATALLYFYNVELGYYLLLHFLAFLALYDYFYKGFPKGVMHLFLLLSVVYSVVAFLLFGTIPDTYVIGLAAVIILLVLLLNLLKNSFGTGDLLVVLMMCIYLNLPQFVGVLFFSILSAGVFATIGLLTGKLGRKDTIPFVPFIFIAYLMTFPFEYYISRYFTSLLYLW